MSMFQKVFGTHSEREVKRIKPLVDKIEALRPTMQALSDEDLRNKTTELPWMTCFRKPMRLSVRQINEFLAWSPTAYS